MPEGPTLHRLARDHTELFGGQTLAITSPQGRFADAAKAIDGRKLLKAEAWGKHLFYDFVGGQARSSGGRSSAASSSAASSSAALSSAVSSVVLHVHLGLYGKYRVHRHGADAPPAPRGAVRVRMTGKTATLDLNGPNQCVVTDAAGRDEVIARLGPDPLRADADPAKAWKRISASRTPIGQLLMDQAVVAGLGNIYRAELLWLIKLHPRTPGKAVTKRQFDRLWKDAKRRLALAVETGRIITTDPKTFKTSPSKLTTAQRFNIYKHPTCPRCGHAIERYPLAGRTVYACAGCQVVQSAED